MTLGSALPWRACSPQGRIQQRFALAAVLLLPRRPPPVGHAALVAARTQSSVPDQTRLGRRLCPSSPEPSSAETTPSGRRPPSLVERLSRVPVRPHHPHDSVVVKPVTQYPDMLENREALLKHHRDYTHQLRLERRRPTRQVDDWRTVLNKLIKWTPPHERRGRIKVVIPKHSVALLSSDHERNLWNIRSRTDCDMMLYRPVDEAAPFDPYIVLSGQPTAMTAAVDDILKVSKGVTVVNLDDSPHAGLESSQAGQPPTEGLDDSAFTATKVIPHQMSVPCRPYRLDMRADQIPRPGEWTIRAFQQYIAALIMGDLDPSRAQELYRDGETHIRVVIRQLHEVFNDPAASAAVSLPALKLALRFLAEAGATYVKDARALFDRAEELGLRVNTDTYNQLAEASVRCKNLPAFGTTISQMVRHGYKPNLGTWLLFLRLIQPEEVRRYILQAMDTKGFFLDPTAVNEVSGVMADHDAFRAIQQRQSFDAFIADLRELYGSEWQLSLRAANRYLDVFGQHSKFEELRQLLEYMLSGEHRKPSAMSLNIAITHCKHQRKVDLAVDLIRMFDEHGLHFADEITYHLLYELARKTKKPHLLGAVWRYAHLVDMTKYRMRTHGTKVLACERESARLTDRIKGLWEEPGRCAITRQEFMENLLLCDYKDNHHRLIKEQPQGTRGQVEESQNSLNRTDIGAGSQAAGCDDDTREEPGPQRTTTLLTAAEKYELYAKAMSKMALDFVPSVRLGDFLQEALDRDRMLHRLAHSDEARNDKTLQVDLDPVRLPIAKREGPRPDEKGLLRWLAENKKEEEEQEEMEFGEDEEKTTTTISHSGHEPADPNIIDVRWAYQEDSKVDGPERATSGQVNDEGAPEQRNAKSNHSAEDRTTADTVLCSTTENLDHHYGGQKILGQLATGRV